MNKREEKESELCCRYIVEIVDQQCYNIEFVNVSNISLAALAVGIKKSHRD